MRIFIGPNEISGIGEGLREGFKELGHQCDVVAVPHPFAYSAPSNRPLLIQAWEWAGKNAANPKKNRVRKLPFYLISIVLSWLVLAWSLSKHDSYIFLFGLTLTNTELELWLLKALRKKIIFCYVGSDVRPPYLNGGTSAGVNAGVKTMHQIVLNHKKRMALHERYADEIISSHNIAQFSSRRLVNWFEIGIPRLTVHCERETRVVDDAGTVTALHSPSNPVTKGTDAILKAVQNLKSKGIRINLVMLHGVPNSEVISAIKKCDFVIDQIYSDTPMAGFATEAAHYGKPSAVGGYFAEEMHDYLRSEIIPPSEFVRPDRIEDAIEKLATDQEYRIALGKRAQSYVTERWSARTVAERYLLLLKGDAPAEWYFDPSSVRYAGGLGLSRHDSGNRIRALSDWRGSAALGVDDKPLLEARLLEWASNFSEAP